jgi:hypothetical protein
MKYTAPELKIEQIQSNDIISASSGFSKTENSEGTEAEFLASLDSLLGNLLNKYDGPLKSTIWMKPEVQNATIQAWWVDTKAKKIIVSIGEEKLK